MKDWKKSFLEKGAILEGGASGYFSTLGVRFSSRANNGPKAGGRFTMGPLERRIGLHFEGA